MPDATTLAGTPTDAPARAAALLARGVVMPRPELVVVDPEVDLARIAAGAVLHPFCRLRGAATRIDAGAEIGPGGPAVLSDCWIGADARIGTMGPVTLAGVTAGPGTVLGSGAAEDAVFLGKEVDDPAISAGLGFRVRNGSLYEEDANSAQHTDTKMTVLFPWATLGSNVNWCDLLMAGGTGPAFDQFSEVGSGAVHFNFTPRGDKATASLLGDVPAGVFLRSPRIFFGGNGSLVGPARVAYGAVTAAGGRYGGELAAGLSAPLGGDGAARPDFDPRIYGSVKRVYDAQVRFIGQLAALDAWYVHGRAALAAGDHGRAALYAAGQEMVRRNLAERIGKLGALAARLEASVRLIAAQRPGDPRIAQQRALLEGWAEIEQELKTRSDEAPPPPAALLAGLDSAAAQHPAYTGAIRALDDGAVSAGTAWLQAIVDRVAAPELLARVPPLAPQ